MVKAGKRVKRQIRKNKKKPTVQVTKQVAKKRMNVRELMLEKMKMGMLVPQQQITPQQERLYNDLEKARDQVNIAEKNLSDAKLKRKAAEEERDKLKAENIFEQRMNEAQNEISSNYSNVPAYMRRQQPLRGWRSRISPK